MRFAIVPPLLLSSLLLLSGWAYADIGSDMEDFFNSIGYANITDPAVYQSQSAGFYSGGGIYTRAPAKHYQLASVSLPGARAGCGGIDLFGGAFSFINDDQLVAMLRNIGQNAVGFAFNLALSTLSPKTEELVNKMQSFANQINSLNINSCETAASLVGGLWPKTDESQKQVCQAIGTSQGVFSDWAAARQGCTAGGERTATLAAGRASPQFQELVFDQGNIAWKALKKNDWTESDTELAELVMNITGTLILRRTGTSDDDPVIPQSIPPKLTDNDLTAFIEGGVIEGLGCADGTGEDQCLQLTTKTFTIDTGFAEQVAEILAYAVEAILNQTSLLVDTPDNRAVRGLLNATTLPVYKMLNVYTAYNSNAALQKVKDYSGLIATDILFSYLQTITDATLASSRQLQIPGDILLAFQRQLQEQRRRIADKRRQIDDRIERSIALVEETQLIERALISSLSPGLAGSYQWAKMLQ